MSAKHQDVVVNEATDRIHQATAFVGSPFVYFERDLQRSVRHRDGRPIDVWGIRLAVTDGGRRAVVGSAAHEDLSFFLDADAGDTIVFPGLAGNGGFQAIRAVGERFEICLQRPKPGELADFLVFDPESGALLRQFEAPQSSLGIIEWIVDEAGDRIVTNMDSSVTRNVRGQVRPGLNAFLQMWFAVERRGYVLGQIDADELGGIGLLTPDGVIRKARVEYDALGHAVGWNGYTNLPSRLAVNRAGEVRVALQGALAPFPDEVVWEEYDPLPKHRLPRHALRACDYVGPGRALQWSRDIEGGYWAFDLFLAGTPARLIFHDTREALEQQYVRTHDASGVRLPAPVPLVHEGEPVTTLWLAKKTGAAILAYQDLNDHLGNRWAQPWLDADGNPAPGAVPLLEPYRRQGYAFYLGQQCYPRLDVRTGRATDPLDSKWCVERSLERNAAAGYESFLFRAGWQGNRMPHGGLAYPEGTLARLGIYLCELAQNEALLVRGHVQFGEDRNDPSAWAIAQYRLEADRTPVPNRPLARSLVVPIVVAPAPGPGPAPEPELPTQPTQPARPRPGGRPRPPASSGGGKTGRNVAIGTGAVAAVTALGKLFGWW
jgi:hypothetical protein